MKYSSIDLLYRISLFTQTKEVKYYAKFVKSEALYAHQNPKLETEDDFESEESLESQQK